MTHPRFFPAREKRQHGAAAIEFALVFPLFVLIFYGIVCYALILLDKQALSAMSADAARNGAAITDASLIPGQIQQAIDGHAWISDRIVECTDRNWGGYYDSALPGGQLQVCLQATPVDLPRINLGIFQLPPDNIDAILRSTATVLWAP